MKKMICESERSVSRYASSKFTKHCPGLVLLKF